MLCYNPLTPTLGNWVVLDGANTVNPSVLDRLNALLEEGGVLTVDERGHLPDGQSYTIVPHPNFRFVELGLTLKCRPLYHKSR